MADATSILEEEENRGRTPFLGGLLFPVAISSLSALPSTPWGTTALSYCFMPWGVARVLAHHRAS